MNISHTSPDILADGGYNTPTSAAKQKRANRLWQSADALAYPDLTMAIVNLKVKRGQADTLQQQLIDKWLGQLEAIQTEMRHLERLTDYSSALKTSLAKDKK